MSGETILVIDPGLATGWSTWWSDEGYVARRLEYGLIHDGAEGWPGSDIWALLHGAGGRIDRVVCEKFDLDGRTARPDLTPKLLEGIIIAWCWEDRVPLTFQPKSHKALVGREPKTRDDRLKQHGLWLTGSDVGHTDGRDVNDSQLHALAYYFDKGHRPTIRRFWSDQSSD